MQILISALSRFTSPTGICRHAANLCHALADRPDVERITFVLGTWQSYYEDFFNKEASGKIDFISVDVRNTSVARNFWFLQGLPALAQSRQVDLVHLSFPVPVRRNNTCKTVVTLHDLYPYDCPEVFGYPNVLFNRFFLRTCLTNVDGIACVSHSTQSRLRALFSPRIAQKAHVIPNIVSMDPTTAKEPANWPNCPFVLVVSQHRRNKNLGLAVRGFAELRNRGIIPSDTRLVIVGSTGPETASLEASIRLTGVEHETMVLSHVPESCLHWLYQNSLLLLLTSTVEGFCLPLIEGLRFSCRIVCSDIPTLREVGGDNCQYFSLTEAPIDSLAAAATRSLSLPKSLPADLERFSFQQVGGAYVRFYSGLLSESRMPKTNDRPQVSSVISKP